MAGKNLPKAPNTPPITTGGEAGDGLDGRTPHSDDGANSSNKSNTIPTPAKGRAAGKRPG
jgi:hypothetical protein